MHRRKREQEKIDEEPKKLEYTLDEAMRTDLRESFDFFKSETGRISRENVKSIMSNFGWINCSSSDLERSIEEMFPTEDGRAKE
jgi:Ca2+-binding EF-hand superfamily protein